MNGSFKPTVPAVNLGGSSFSLAIWIKPVLGSSQYVLSAEDQFRLHLNQQGGFRAKLVLDDGSETWPFGFRCVCICCHINDPVRKWLPNHPLVA